MNPTFLTVVLGLVVVPLLFGPGAAAHAADETAATATQDIYQPRTLDGVQIEAVETYLNPRQSELGLGVGFYPFNAYYNGLALNASYTHHFSRTFAWEILNGSYVYTFDKTLTAELADLNKLQPKQVERVRFLASTQGVLTHSNGKLIFLKEYVRYFRSSLLFGAGLISTNQQSSFAPSLGLRFEVFTSSSFSWKLDVRDYFSVSSLDHFVFFSLGTGFSF